MAKKTKRKLNPKVVIALSVAGVVLLVLVGVGLYIKRDRIWPMSPAASVKLGDEALLKGNFQDAVKNYKDAVGNSKGRDKSDRLLKLAEIAYQWLVATPNDQSAQKRERYDLFRAALNAAKRETPAYLEPHKRLVEHWFSVVVSQPPANRPYSDFMNEADELIKLDPADHLTLYRRGFVNALRSEADVQAFGEKALADFRKAVELKRGSMDKDAVKALSGPGDAAKDPKIAKEIDELSEYWSRYISFLQFLRLKQRIEPEAIIQAYQDASVSMPNVPDFYVGLGNFLYRTLGTDERLKAKYKPQAIELFKNAIKVSPTAAVGYLAWTEILINDGIRFKQAGQKDQAAAMYEKAIAVLGEARKNTEELHRICHAQAVVFEQQGEFAKGINAYRQAIDELQRRSASTQPGSPPATQGARTMPAELVKGMTGELYYRLGHALLNDAARKEEKDRQTLIDEAAKCLTAMQGLTKDATSVNLEVRLEILNQKYEQAYRILEKTYRTNRNVLTLQNTMLLADLCMSRSTPNMAQDILKDMPEPAEAEPAIQVLLLKARCRSILNDAAGANTLLDEVLKREPENAIALKMKAQMDTGKERQEALIKWREGLRDPAIRDMERICRQRPDDVQAIRELATMYDTAGRRADLLAMLEEARKRLPEDKSIKMACAVYAEADPAKRKAVYYEQLQTITDPFEKNIRMADYFATSDQLEQAVGCLEKAQALKPKDTGVMGQLFAAQLRRSKFDDARKWAMEMAKLEPEMGQNALGELGMTLRDAPAAIEAFTKVLATNKQAKGVLVNRGRCYLTQEKYDLAEKDFQAAWNLDNRYLEAAIGLAKAAAGRKDTSTASKWVQTAIDLPEGIRDKWIRNMAMVSLEARKETTVQNLIQRREAIIAVDPTDADNRLLLGELYQRANEPEKAEAQYTLVYTNSADAKVRAATKLAELYVSTRRPEKAKGILNEVQRQASDRVGALLAYAGYILQTEGATPECQKMIEEAVGINAKDARAHWGLAQFYKTSQEWDKAVAALDTVLKLGVQGVPGATESDVRGAQVECVIRSRQFDRAKKDIDAMFARDKDDAVAFSLLYSLYQEQGQVDKAKGVLTDALKIHKNSSPFYRALGALHLRLGELQEAQDALAKAREFNPRDDAIGMTLGRVYERLRLFDKARAEYVAVMSLNAAHRGAYERLMQLYLREQDWAKFTYLIEQAKQSFPDEPMVLMQEGQMWIQRKEVEKGLARMKQASEMPRGGDMGILGTYLATLGAINQYAVVLSATEQRAAQADPPAWLLGARAMAMARLNKLAEADALFLQALKAGTLGDASYIFQRVRDAFGDAVTAEKARAWGQAVPKNWAWQFELGQMFGRQINAMPKGAAKDELVGRAVAELVKARDMADTDKTKADINFFLGTMYQLADRPQDAEQAYLLVLKTAPRHLQANNNLSILCADELKQPKRALEYAETVMKYHEIDANSLDTYGWALAQTGEYEKAADSLTRAKVQDPEMPDIRYHLGWTMEKLKKLPEARAEYKRGAEIVGSDKGSKLSELLQAGMERVK